MDCAYCTCNGDGDLLRARDSTCWQFKYIKGGSTTALCYQCVDFLISHTARLHVCGVVEGLVMEYSI